MTLTSVVPKTIVHPQNITTKEGGNLTIYCNATGNPDPTVSWTKDGSLIRRNLRITMSADGKQLTITNASASDSGEYRCTAVNSIGKYASIASTVNVQCKCFLFIFMFCWVDNRYRITYRTIFNSKIFFGQILQNLKATKKIKQENFSLIIVFEMNIVLLNVLLTTVTMTKLWRVSKKISVKIRLFKITLRHIFPFYMSAVALKIYSDYKLALLVDFLSLWEVWKNTYIYHNESWIRTWLN